jgi:hypothetical protein
MINAIHLFIEKPFSEALVDFELPLISGLICLYQALQNDHGGRLLLQTGRPLFQLTIGKYLVCLGQLWWWLFCWRIPTN